MPSDEQIEVAAEAAYLGMRKRNKPWSMVSAWEKAEWRLATRAALEAAERVAWQPIESAPKDRPVDVWLGDAEPEDVDFYCTPGTRRSPGWHWVQGKWRLVNGLPPMTVFVQPTHWRLPPGGPQ